MTASSSKARAAGIALVVTSATVFSTAGIFTRGVEAGAWAVIFWRGLASAGFILVYLVMTGALAREIRAFDRRAFFIAAIGALGTAAFIPAFKLSSVANVALIYAAAPFVAAGLSWLFLRERPERRIMLASGAALIGVAIIVSGAMRSGAFLGDLLALVMTIMMAGVMTAYRKWPDVTAALPSAVSSLLLLPVALMVAPVAVGAGELTLLLLFGLVFALASVTLAAGSKRLPSSETALLSALEVPLAPLLAFAVLAEAPGPRTMVGGALVLAAILWAQRRSVKRRRHAV